MDPVVEQLKRYHASLTAWYGQLDALTKYVGENPGAYVLPILRQSPDGETSEMAFDVIGSDGVAVGAIDSIPAAFLYETYQEVLPQLIATARKKAEDSVGVQAQALAQQLEERKQEIAGAEEALEEFLKL